MKKVSYEELTKIASFIASCNNMINGKFILADVKILKILKEIAESEELYHFISECLIGFDFEKEYHRSEIKNRFNGGMFKMPEEPEKIVALAFSLLVEFDAKRLDFYQFINENFITAEEGKEYAAFANAVLVPMRNIITEYFGLVTDINDENREEFLQEYEKNYPQEIEIEEEEEVEESVFDNIHRICDMMLDAIKSDFKIKFNQKQNIVYIVEGIIYCLQYEDMRLVSSFVVAFDAMQTKSKTTALLFRELKSILENYYNQINS